MNLMNDACMSRRRGQAAPFMNILFFFFFSLLYIDFTEFILSSAAIENKHASHSCCTFMFFIVQLTVTLLPHFRFVVGGFIEVWKMCRIDAAEVSRKALL